MLERLDVDVGRAALYRVVRESVDQLHDRGVVARSCALTSSSSWSSTTSKVFLGLDALEQALELGVGLLVVTVDRVAEGILAGDDRKDVASG